VIGGLENRVFRDQNIVQGNFFSQIDSGHLKVYLSMKTKKSKKFYFHVQEGGYP
jgi:hypothetical protein